MSFDDCVTSMTSLQSSMGNLIGEKVRGAASPLSASIGGVEVSIADESLLSLDGDGDRDDSMSLVPDRQAAQECQTKRERAKIRWSVKGVVRIKRKEERK